MALQDALARLSTLYRWDVLVEMKEVGWIIKCLDRYQPVPRGPGIGCMDAVYAFVPEEVDVGSAIALFQRCREIGNPGFMYRLIFGPFIKRGKIDHDARLSVSKCCGIRGDAGHGTAEYA